MARIKGVIVIGRPVDVVFNYVADQSSEPRYNPQMVPAARPVIIWLGMRQEQRIWTSLKKHMEAAAAVPAKAGPAPAEPNRE
jgi:hypothetical protein